MPKTNKKTLIDTSSSTARQASQQQRQYVFPHQICSQDERILEVLSIYLVCSNSWTPQQRRNCELALAKERSIYLDCSNSWTPQQRRNFELAVAKQELAVAQQNWVLPGAKKASQPGTRIQLTLGYNDHDELRSRLQQLRTPQERETVLPAVKKASQVKRTKSRRHPRSRVASQVKSAMSEPHAPVLER